MMQCPECQELLQRRLDGEDLGLTPNMAEHIAGCAGCRLLLAASDVFAHGFPASADAPPSDLAGRVLERVLADRVSRRRRSRLKWLVTTALAASIAVMVLAGRFLPVRHKPTVPDIAKKGITAPVEPAPVALGQSMDDARQAVAAMSGRWAARAKEQTKALFSSTLEDLKLPALPEASPLQPAAQSLQQAGQSVAEGLQPMAQTARRALAYFAKEVPVLEKAQ
jgi:hypothetical protein